MDTLAPAPHPPALEAQNMSPDAQERDDVARASRLLDRRWSWLRFPARLERQFLQDALEARLHYVLVSGVLSLIVFDGFLLADYLMAPDVFDLAVKVRLGVFSPIAVLVLAVGWRHGAWMVRVLPPITVELIVLASGLFAAACVSYILAASRSPTAQYYHVGLMVVIMYGNMVQRLRFWYAVVFSLAVYAMHIGGVLMLPGANLRLVIPMVGLLGATVVFTLMTNYALERDERRHYLLSLRRKHLLRDVGGVHERLKSLSLTDALTGLYNRRHVDGYLQQTWQRAAHDGDDVSVVMLDVDHFKRYNDRYGHPAGDACLAKVAEVMAASLRRPADLVARFGGEEFIAVLPQTSGPLAQQAAERIRAAVQALAIPHADSESAPVVTVSLGVACLRAGPGIAERSLVAAADSALYQAKQQGRNRVVRAGEADHADADSVALRPSPA